MSHFSRSGHRALMVFAVALSLSALTGLDSFAQTTTATVNGTVKDAQGAVVTGATVTLTDMATMRAVTATTNSEGAFVFTDVRSGEYIVTAEAAGFKKTETRGVKVNVGLPATVNLELQAGGVAETVTAMASEAQTLVNTENAELGTTVYSEQINDLPLNGRNPVQLALLQAGVATISGTRNATINGMRGSYNNITWDGINVQETYLRGNSSSGLFAQAGPSVSGVGEFTITTQNTGASDGTGAAQVKLVTPRGSNELPRQPLRVPPQRRVRRQHFLQQPRRAAEAEAHPEPVRRHPGRPLRAAALRRGRPPARAQEQALLLHLLRRDARRRAGRADAHHADERRPRRPLQLPRGLHGHGGQPVPRRRRAGATPDGQPALAHRQKHRPAHPIAAQPDARAERHHGGGRPRQHRRLPLQQPRREHRAAVRLPHRLRSLGAQPLRGRLQP